MGAFVNLETTKIGFIGFGNMASAMADGWIASDAVLAENMCACAGRFDALKVRCEERGMHALENAEAVVEASDVVIIAVKPYMIERVLGPVAQLLVDKVVLSVAAGWDCESYERVIPGARHLSTVPNTPVAINEGVITCEKASTLTEDDHALVFALLDLLGTPVEVETRLLSVAGTVGGCSPAFIAMVIEALADAAGSHRPGLVDQMGIFIVPEGLHGQLWGNPWYKTVFLFLQKIAVHDGVEACGGACNDAGAAGGSGSHQIAVAQTMLHDFLPKLCPTTLR